MPTLARFPLVAALHVSLCLAVSVSSALGQEPDPPTLQLDSAQIHQVPDQQLTTSGTLVLPDSFLQNVRPEHVTRIGPDQVTTDTSIGAGGQSLSLDSGEVAVLSDGATFSKRPSTSVVPYDSVLAPDSAAPDAPVAEGPPAGSSGAIGRPVYQAPIQFVSNAGSGSPAQGTLLMRSQQNGFVMTDRPSIFETTLQIWLESDAGGEQVPLATPVETVVTAENAVSVESSPFTLEYFNDITTVNIRARPQRDSLTVTVGLPGQNSPRAQLGVRRPELRVSASPRRIEGFGLGESTVQVHVPSSYPSTVSLSAATQLATAEPAAQEIKPGALGRFTIHSWGVGEETIRIRGGTFGEVGRTVHVDFIWPVYFILFAVAGSLTGGGIRYYRRRSSKGKRRIRLPGILASGVLIGIVGAVLYGIGVSLFPLIPAGKTGQAVVFAVSAAAAVTGPTLPFEEASVPA